MSNLFQEGSTKTPYINFDAEQGVLEMKGRSIPEVASEFYQPLLDWINQYMGEPKRETNVSLMFEYFNTSSSKCILDVFKLLEDLHKSGKSVVNITWNYTEEDEAMYEAGMEYQALVSMKFIMNPLEEN